MFFMIMIILAAETLSKHFETEECRMPIKQTILTALIFGLINCNGLATDNTQQENNACPTSEQLSTTTPSQRPKIFDEEEHTKINGNPILLYFHTGAQLKGSPEFLKTMIVEFTENREFKEQGSLREAKKNWYSSPSTRKFMRYAKANDAIFCPDITQEPNRDGELKNIGVIIYGTQNIKNCDRFAEYLKNKSHIEEVIILQQ